MKRRDFLTGSFYAALALSFIPKVLAGVKWAVENKLGYKKVAPPNMIKLGKHCSTCGWYKVGGKEKGAGLCTFPSIHLAAGATKEEELYVLDGAVCSMWKKKA